jgi:hypothetical protein
MFKKTSSMKKHNFRSPLQRIVYRATSLALALVFLSAPVVTHAQVSSEQKKIFRDGIGYFDFKDTECSGAAASGNIPAGTLPAFIPEPYNGMMTKGANMFKVAPALIAAIFTEENFTHSQNADLAARWASFLKAHPDPNSGWPTNQFQTMGAFQFIPGTWAAYGADGDGDGIKDAQHFADGAAGAANYLAANGGTADKPPASWQNAIFNYNHAQWYVDAVLQYYNFYNSGGTNTGAGTTPLPATTTQNTSCGGTSAAVNCTPATSADPAVATPAPATTVATKVVCLAQAEYALWKAGTLKPGTDFHKYSQGLDYDWCAYFVSWIYNQAGYPMKGTNQGIVGLVSDIKQLGLDGGRFTFTQTPKPGDLAIHDKGSSHVNMVTAVNGNSITMIGGNQSSNNFRSSEVSQYITVNWQTSDISGFVSPTQ